MKRISLFITVLFFFTRTMYAQQIDSIMESHAEMFPKEKIHIHFDKQLYNTDETVWYKLYLLTDMGPSPLSMNVYVDWYDTTGKVLRHTVAPLFQSTAKGSFDIPVNYTGQFIRVKAYTRWMLNDDTSFIYQKDIQIHHPSATAKKKVATGTRVELFPEGGHLVLGLDEKIAFKATSSSGLPVMIKGQVLNNKNEVLDSLRIKHDGMGLFFLRPQAGEQYRVEWIDENGNRGSTPVTGIQQEGVSMSIAGTNDRALIQVERTEKTPANQQQLNLLVHMNERPVYKVRLIMTSKMKVNAAVPIDELPTGILQFSLFTDDWLPLEERIIFVNNHLHEFNAKVNPGIISLEKRGKNVLEVFVSDTASANMSISITDAALAGTEQYNIFSDFLLSNQLRGYIHNPAYYLKSDADSITSRLDLVMLTNGWRRFDWEKVKAAEKPVIQYEPETNYIQLKGKVYGMETGGKGPGMLNFILRGKDSSVNMHFVPIQRDGSFDEPIPVFFDTSRVFYNFNDKNKSGYVAQVQLSNGLLKSEPGKTISIDQQPFVQAGSDSLALERMNLFLSEEEKLRKSMASATLQEVVVKSKIKVKDPLQELDDKYASGLFSGGDAYSFDLVNDKFPGALNILAYLQGKVAGLQISGSGSQMSLNWRGGVPSLYLNEMMTNVEMIQSIPVSDVAYIKVMRPPFFGAGGGGANGAVAIYTKKGNDTRKNDPDSKGMETTILAGYSRFREFYNPSYTKEATYETDVRSTLYWNPYILTNKKTPRFRIEFHNNDFSKKLLVVLEGINADGKMVRTVRYIE